MKTQSQKLSQYLSDHYTFPGPAAQPNPTTPNLLNAVSKKSGESVLIKIFNSD